MKKLITLFVLVAVLATMSVCLVACDEEEEPVATIDRYEFTDITLKEGEKLDLTKSTITCYMSDDTTKTVTKNLTYDTTVFGDKLGDDSVLAKGSNGTYEVKVFHLEKEIGVIKVIVKISK